MNYSIFSMLSKIGIFKVVVVASSSVSILSKTTGLPSPLCHHHAFRRRSVIITITPSITFAMPVHRLSLLRCAPPPHCRQVPPTSRCCAAATAASTALLPPHSSRFHAAATAAAAALLLPLCRHRRSAAKLPPTSRCRAATTAAAATAAPPFVGWLLRCCPPSDFVIACRHATINALVAGRFRQ